MRAQGRVTPVKAKYYAYFCIVVVCGVLSRQYEMRQLLVAHRKADSYLLSPSGGLLLCVLRDPPKYEKNRDPKIIGERYQIIAGLACSSTRPTREDEILLLFSFLLYILRDPPKGDRRVGVLQ